MTTTRRHLAGFGIVALLLLGGCERQRVESGSEATIDVSGAEEVALLKRLPWPPRTTTTTKPRPTTTTTVRPTPTTAAPAPTTTAPPAPAPTTPTTVRPTTTTVRPAPAPTTTVAPAPTTTVAPAPAPSGGLPAATANELLALVNAKRATGTTCGGVAYPAVPALSLNGAIANAAQAHAVDMAAYDYFSHTGRNGSSPGQRMTAAGYNWSAWSENIAAGQQTPSAVVAGWFGSTGHCQNFMSGSVTQIGFGQSVNPSSTYRIYWVADMGRPR